jgi:hypothetical protein
MDRKKCGKCAVCLHRIPADAHHRATSRGLEKATYCSPRCRRSAKKRRHRRRAALSLRDGLEKRHEADGSGESQEHENDGERVIIVQGLGETGDHSTSSKRDTAAVVVDH